MMFMSGVAAGELARVLLKSFFARRTAEIVSLAFIFGFGWSGFGFHGHVAYGTSSLHGYFSLRLDCTLPPTLPSPARAEENSTSLTGWHWTPGNETRMQLKVAVMVGISGLSRRGTSTVLLSGL